ncbi:MAG: aspartate aminotransferase family protein [Alphaproteobacteria bacterium]
MNKARDWDQLERWDRSYYLHSTQAAAEHVYTAVESMDGNYFTLADGTRMLDFQSQLISDSMGHRHPAIHAELARAMERYGHVQFGMAHEYRARAAKLIIEDVIGANSWAGRVRVFSSGTDAVECATNMARLYTGRSVILTQAHSFHGMVMGSTMMRGYRNNLTPDADRNTVRDVPGFPPHGYIPVPPPEHEDYAANGTLPSIVATEQIIQAIGPENIAGVITEPMLGGGGTFPHAAYMPALVGLARKYGFLWIDDEVITGFGRLGEWFGYQCWPGLTPDILAGGKGVNSCALPVGVVIASKQVADLFEKARWWSGSTWDGHPLVCATIVGNLEYMLANNIIQQVRQRGAYLKERLDALKPKHPSIGRISGRGLFQVIDLVNDKGAPIVPEDRFSAFTGDLGAHPNVIVYQETAKRGVYLGGFTPNTLKLGPPFTVTQDDIDLAVDALDAALDVVEAKYHKGTAKPH